MIVELPEWQPFTAGRAPWTPESSERGRLVLVLAPSAASRERWSAEVTLGIADAWGEAGRRVVVADCVLEHPTLHRTAGLGNAEGVADAALFGASVSRIAQPVPGRSFYFVSAGSPAGDPETVVTSARWRRLQDGFRDAGVTLVVFLREGCVGESMLIEGADDIVVLTDSSERVPSSARAAAGKIRVLVGVDGAVQVSPDVEADTTPEDATATLDLDEGWAIPADPGSADPTGTAVEAPALAGLGDGDPAEPEHDEVGADELEEPEAAMDFAVVPTNEVEGAPDARATPADESEGKVNAPLADADSSDPASTVPAVSRRDRRGGADPDARRKLLWVGLAVLVLVLLVVLGALRQG